MERVIISSCAATGIAQSVKSVSGSATVGGGLRNAVFTGPILGDSLVSTPPVGPTPMSPRMNAGHPPTSTHSHTHTHLHNHPHTHTHALPPTSSGVSTEPERGQMVQVSPRVAVSASPGMLRHLFITQCLDIAKLNP